MLVSLMLAAVLKLGKCKVLYTHAYEAQQREYALKGHRDFYFMTLNGSEVIDASAKGNLGCFIYHSCDPNYRTKKWSVNGKICIELFALRDIKQVGLQPLLIPFIC
ncbi:hypothetical protein HN51_047870 [Arachis hypogaea]